ncbi:YbhB/YbcL family Raf kinase inhibitor-like protein [Desulfurobacterium indicum]|uniref:Phosphatidylethanolamine-binding protein n=1 Tax=Desulfurobacterium indicum TaxID=1914305 RepID=A0A1R1ML96_9BACT|nr:YbhB/YbcL family Raf kinase inhibitor-like protein [Desulfurobacterium indicum]OMH40536.1 phosphatidylethanolamine-binding protein [Desulfurobacterium indicum]
MEIVSPAFGNGEFIPSKYTCDGEDVSPCLFFLNPPETVKSFALIVEDPDAPAGTFTHWVIYDIPGDFEGLPEDVPPAANLEYGIKQGLNDFGRIGYNGPCPPPGKPHRYFFILLALDIESTGLPSGATRSELLRAIDGHVITTAEMVGLYGR